MICINGKMILVDPLLQSRTNSGNETYCYQHSRKRNFISHQKINYMRAKTLAFFFLFPILISCDQKTEKYFEDVTDITIPASARVNRDEYRDMGQGHSQVLELNLEAVAKNELLHSILKSHYFKHIDTIINPLNPMPLIQHGKYKGLWYKQKNGFAFYGTTLNERDVITATFDSMERKMTFGSFAD